MAAPEHIPVVSQPEGVSFKFGDAEVDATGVTGMAIAAVIAGAIIYKFFFNKKKNIPPVGSSGSKPASAADIKHLTTHIDKIAASLGNGIDENRKEIQKVGKCVERLDERTERLEEDIKETRADVKKLQADQAFLSGRLSARTNGKNAEPRR